MHNQQKSPALHNENQHKIIKYPKHSQEHHDEIQTL